MEVSSRMLRRNIGSNRRRKGSMPFGGRRISENSGPPGARPRGGRPDGPVSDRHFARECGFAVLPNRRRPSVSVIANASRGSLEEAIVSAAMRT